MANRCFITGYDIQSGVDSGTFVILASMTLMRDDSPEVYQVAADVPITFSMTVNQIENAINTKVREIAEVSGYPLQAGNGIIKLDLIKA